MIETLTTYEIADRLATDPNSSFTRAGALALAKHLEEMEEESGTTMEFDRVAIRCDYTQYESALDAAEAFGFEPDEDDDDDDKEKAALKWLEDETTVLEFEGGVVIRDF